MSFAYVDNYFALLGVPRTFQQDTTTLTQQYHALARKYHPDFHAQADATTQQTMLLQSAQLTAAYRAISKPALRMVHLFQLEGLLDGALQNVTQVPLPKDFLAEMMDLNEALEVYQENPSSEALERFQASLKPYTDTLHTQIHSALAAHDAATSDENRSAALLQAFKLYLQQKYILRIEESLGNIASGN